MTASFTTSISLGWRELLQLLPANVRIGLVIVPLSTLGYLLFWALTPGLRFSWVVIAAVAVGAGYLALCLIRASLLLHRGVLAEVVDLRVSRPQEFALSHLYQIDYTYRHEGSLFTARELFSRNLVRDKKYHAIVDPRKPSRVTLLAVNK